MIRVLVVDDSAVQRALLEHLLTGDPLLTVVGSARDRIEAVELAERLRPDVILMDLHMPRANGIEATRRIMERAPTPIVIASASAGRDEMAITFEAVSAGALDVVEMPPGPDHPGHAEAARRLCATVKSMAEVKVVRRWAPREAREPRPAGRETNGRDVRLIAIGASTGGPQTLAPILNQLPESLAAPILVVQHIAPGFTQGLAQWLDQVSPLNVKVAESGEPAVPGACYLAPNGFQMGIASDGRILVTNDGPEDRFRPSISYLFRSVAQACGSSAMGILLTGMGRDGANGLAQLRAAGGMTVAQDEASAVIFGMPGEAIRLGAAEYVLAPEAIVDLIRSHTPRP